MLDGGPGANVRCNVAAFLAELTGAVWAATLPRFGRDPTRSDAIAYGRRTLIPSLAMTLNRWTVSAIGALCFASGALFTSRVTRMQQVHADSNRVFELRIYHTVPGKTAALQSEFREQVTKLFAKHDMKAVGYWAPVDAPASNDTFIYILAHPSRDAAKAHWDAFRMDPAFQEMMKGQQGDAKIVEKVDSTYMSPVDFSPMK